ncbi:MAG: hypothetical protein J5620_04480 [Alphaproteobacteria bacterium]|nr:hypothetical protein [Alphaproteobacteria bacterium]
MKQHLQSRKNAPLRAFVLCGIFLISNLLMLGQSYSVELKQRQFGAGLQTADTTGYSIEVPGTEGMSEMEVVQTLRQDIQLLDEEIMKCDRKRKGWVAATVVGGVGVVGTGIGAIVQHNKIQDKKSELGHVQGEVAGTKANVKDAENRLNNM